MSDPKIKWSFSGLKDFVNCPHQYYQTKVLKAFSKSDTPQTIYGKEVHKALEDYTRDGTPLLENYKRFKDPVDALLEIPGTKYPEQKFALLEDKQTPCDFDHPDYFVRGIADLAIVYGSMGYVFDYKTGSNKYPDLKQLKLMAIFMFAHFPELQRVRAGLLFVAHNSFLPEEYNREDIPRLWNAFVPDIIRLRVSHHTKHWPKNPTGLCGWCPVTNCEFWRQRRK